MSARRAAKNHPTSNRRADASDRRISDLLFTARQRKQWADFARTHGREAEAKAHEQKSKGAVSALKTLGYTGDIFR